MIFRDRDLMFNSDGSLNTLLICRCIQEHNKEVDRLTLLENYYNGIHDILNRTKSNKSCANEKAIVNHAKEIVDMATGYVYGYPISYSSDEENFDEILNHFTIIDEDSHDSDLGLNQSLFGKAYELIYMDNEDYEDAKIMPYFASLSPINTFVVYDTTIKQKPMFAVTYSANYDINNVLKDYTVSVYTDSQILIFKQKTLADETLHLISVEDHLFQGIPIVELLNNKYERSDFEDVLNLIDLYNILQSDRINDKEQLVDALLVIQGANLGDDEEEQSETAKYIRDNRILELGEGGQAAYLTKQLHENEIEVLKKAISDDIHKISKVPDMTDQNFVGNSSGIAMRYKLLGLEQLGNIKERFFKKMLRKRFTLINNVLRLKNLGFERSKISIAMKRNLPVDLDEKLKELQATEGVLSLETRLKRYDKELNVDEEIKKLEKEQLKKAEIMSSAYGNYNFKQDQRPDPKNDSKTNNSDEDKKESVMPLDKLGRFYKK